MSKPNRATQEKRNRERNQKQKAEEKLVERAQRKEARMERIKGSPDEDPDLAGIVPGPQPIMGEDGLF